MCGATQLLKKETEYHKDNVELSDMLIFLLEVNIF